MEHIIFGIYILALIALVVSGYAVTEVIEIKREIRRKQIEDRLKKVVQPYKTQPKSPWK